MLLKLPTYFCSSRQFFRAVAFVRPQQRLLSVRLSSTAAKTPVQEFGFEYLKRQMNLGRPLSPHLQIYKPQLTWVMSGVHRILACIMSGALLVGVFVFGICSVDFTSFAERLNSWNLWRPVTNSVKFVIAFPLVYHILNGIRFMAFDMAKGTELASVYRSGYLVIGLSTLISLLIVANSKHLTKEQFQQKYKKEANK
ncbi:hypothetical protein niasHT_024037 [Heterodera trifolii]|uniref:Succinate dehydrogenase cytochrome b560 subunit, mitochondrial n=1 Tax=Heterodera trifolii TaxID=157864 RepID=A0ABD2KPM0_9BILA